MVFRRVRGVIDRIETNEEGLSIGVVLIEDEELQLEIPMRELPETSSAGTWLQLELDASANIGKVFLLKEETEYRRQQLQGRWQRLRKRSQ